MNQHAFVIENLLAYVPIPLTETPHSAAVMVLLLTNDYENYEIVLTKRASNLPTYADHYCLPGGFREIADISLFQTAEREVKEELNIDPSFYQYAGQLDDFTDRDGHLVRPFAVIMNKMDFMKHLKISTHEISELYYFPLQKLEAIHDDPRLHQITRRRPSYTFTDGHVFIWGLTASILVHVLAVLTDKSK